MRKNFQVLVCDRCDFMSDDRKRNDQDDWGQISAYSWKYGAEKIEIGYYDGRQQRYKDLCPGCIKEVSNWFNNGKVKND